MSRSWNEVSGPVQSSPSRAGTESGSTVSSSGEPLRSRSAVSAVSSISVTRRRKSSSQVTLSGWGQVPRALRLARKLSIGTIAESLSVIRPLGNLVTNCPSALRHSGTVRSAVCVRVTSKPIVRLGSPAT